MASVPELISRLALADLLHPSQRAKEFFDECFLRRQPGESLCIGCLEIDGDTVCKLHEALHLSFFGARHNLQMQIAAEAKLLSQDFRRIQDLILRIRSARRDP